MLDSEAMYRGFEMKAVAADFAERWSLLASLVPRARSMQVRAETPYIL
jgi:hypothetical protein